MRPFTLLASLVASAVLATPALAQSVDINEPAAVPRSHQIKAQHRRSALQAATELASRASKSVSNKKGARLTYYWGRQLQAPACGGPTPTDDDMIAAIVDPKKGGGYAKCGDRITLSHKGRQITVKVVDYCASCAVPGFDLSKGAFAKLAYLDQGVIEDVEFWKAGSTDSPRQDEEVNLGGLLGNNKGPGAKQQLKKSHTKTKQQCKETRRHSRTAKKAARKHAKKVKAKKAKKGKEG